MKKRLIFLLVCMLAFSFIIYESKIPYISATEKVTITESVANIRSGPGTSNSVIKQAHRGESYELTNIEGDWFQIKLNDNESGWVANWVAENSTNDLSSNNSNYKIGIVTTELLNVRSSNSADGQVIGRLQENDEVTILSEENSWFEISFKQATGWVASEYVHLVNLKDELVTENINEIPENLSGYIGTVSGSTLNVRKKPTFKGKVLATVSSGDHFEILEEKDNWAKIEYKKGKYGWVASWFLKKTYKNSKDGGKKQRHKNYLTILHNETNLREKPSTKAAIVSKSNQGDKLEIISRDGDWYEVKLRKGRSAFVAGWVVRVENTSFQVERHGVEHYFKNKVILIDPGHGGNDRGTTGVLGTIEKQLTLKTAQLVANKLRDAGATVILTRTSDTYMSLPARVQMNNYYNADAFISLHFDSVENDNTVNGMTTYYYYDFQKELAKEINNSLVNVTNLKDRGTKQGDYYVLRENYQNAILIELGYLSNPSEEGYISTTQFQEKVATGIYKGLAKYFLNN